MNCQLERALIIFYLIVRQDELGHVRLSLKVQSSTV